MINGQQISEARQRAGLTQQQLAERVGVSLRTVGNWERGATVPRASEHHLRAVLSDHLDGSSEVGLRVASDVELLAEIARRLSAARREDVMGNAEHPAPTKTPPAGVVVTDSVTPPPGWTEGASQGLSGEPPLEGRL